MMPEVTMGTGRGLSVVHPPYPLLALSQWTSAPGVSSRESPNKLFFCTFLLLLIWS